MITGVSFRSARRGEGWSQEQASDRIGVAVRTIRNWEGTGRIPERMWARIVTALPAAWVGERPFIPPPLPVRPAGDRIEETIREVSALRSETTDPAIREHLRVALGELMAVEDRLLETEEDR